MQFLSLPKGGRVRLKIPAFYRRLAISATSPQPDIIYSHLRSMNLGAAHSDFQITDNGPIKFVTVNTPELWNQG